MYTYVPIIIIIIIRLLGLSEVVFGGRLLSRFRRDTMKEKGEERIRRYFLNHLLSNWSITSHT